MMRCTVPARSRRGAILLVVVLLLTLFAMVGLAFVLYAQSEATAARLQVDAETPHQADVDPDVLLAYFLNQFLYDAPDDDPGVYSALRGHSLGRNMYGGNAGPSAQPAANLVPFNGTGHLAGPSPFGPQVNDSQLINFTYYRDDPQLPPGQRFLRDPERLGWRPPDPSAPRGPFAGGFNVPYTYPDLNTTFLAAVRADGTVLLPSFHRPWAAAVPSSGLTADAAEFYDRSTGQLNSLWSPQPPALPPWFKYTTLRPLPALNPGFPPPEDGGGDVKNLMGGPGTLRRVVDGRPEFWSCDSSWIDLGFPVLIGPDGRKYKPLFAPLIVDLDNRVNVNVHGNAQGPDGSHYSNQGWGPWEVNLGQVLTHGDEWHNLLRGAGAAAPPGRYGKTGTPGVPGDLAPPGRPAHFYGQVDFDGRNERVGGPSGPALLPGLGGPPGSCFPAFLTAAGAYAGYGNRSPAERRNHPSLYNLFQPAGDDRAFAVANLEAHLRYGDTGSPALTSELFRLCPVNFADPRARGLVTTHSFDPGRPGVSPWLHDLASFPYEAGPTLDPDQPALPQGPPIPPPPLPRPGVTPDGEFGPTDWRALTAALGRVDLSRPLPPYPHQGSGKTPPFGPPLTRRGGQPALDIPFDVDAPNGPIWKQFVLAQSARQQLANDLYRRLLAVTGVAPILPDQVPEAPPAALLRTRRWLAQLAVNVVDFIDEDDISTPFCFYTAEDYQGLAEPPLLPPDPDRVGRPDSALLPGRPGQAGEIQWPLYWVFGTELPRVVVNEVLGEMSRDDPDGAYPGAVRVFVELHNPFPRSLPGNVYQPDALPVPLWMGAGGAAYTPYRVVLGVGSPAPPRPTGAAILPGPDNDNVLGNPEPAVVRQATTDLDFAPGAGVPAHGPGVIQGFLLLGPPPSAFPPFAARDPFTAGPAVFTPTVRSPNLEYSRFFPIPSFNDPPDERTGGVTVLLRRLANPYLRFDPQRRSPTGLGPNLTYNPYMTVDYVEDVPVYPVDGAGPVASTGRLQPYAAHRSQLALQTARQHPVVWNTFGRANEPAPDRYDWLTHLDRRPSSPLELLQVSGYQSYQLTQRFVCPDADGQVVKFGQRAPWLDEGRAPGGPSHRLYRLFEFLEAGTGAAGVAPEGRVPGRINLNTIWDPETFRAICDPQPANAFTSADVDQLFTQFLYDPTNAVPGPMRRTPGLVPGGADRPFQGFAAGTCPSGTGPDGATESLARLGPFANAPHPYLADQLLTKIAGQVTARSNVFAVWLTVGFFEVTDDSTRPVKLGAEIGRAETRHVRHRMFAIVDRTNLSIASCVSALAASVPPPPPAPLPVSAQTVPVSALSGTLALWGGGPGIPWDIRPGTALVVGAGADQETVQVLAVDTRRPPTLTAVFTKAHATGAALSLANVPGAPPVFLEPLAVARPDPLPVPPYVPPLPYAVTVRLAVDPKRSSAAVLAGRYEGIPWEVRPGTPLILDVGPNQEVVAVQPAGFAFDPATATGAFRVVVTRPHGDRFTIANTFTGNPGPQLRFVPRDPVFGAVVRYVSIIQ
jgi:hypothetical protein